MYREAVREHEQSFAYFRFWSFLEAVARSKNFDSRLQLDWSGAVRVTPKGSPRLVGDHAKDLVFELLRDALSEDIGETGLASGLQQGSFGQLVAIWYRRRNCVGHGGECLCRNGSLAHLRAKNDYENCRLAREEEAGVSAQAYLQTLREAARSVLFSELRPPT